MLVLNGPSETGRITDPAIRALVEKRYAEICAGDPYDYDKHGYMVVVEPGDTVKAIEDEVLVPMLSNFMDEETHFRDPGYMPPFEWLVEHPACYEGTLILTDDGFGVGIFIPKVAGVDSDLLEMCATYAEPAPELTQH